MIKKAAIAGFIGMAGLLWTGAGFADEAVKTSFAGANAQIQVSDEETLNRAYAILVSNLPEGAKLIHAPYPHVIGVYGANQKHRMVKDENVPGGDALRVEVRRKGRNQWDVGAGAAIGGAINEGDVIFTAFWARAEKFDEDEGAGTLPFSISLGEPPYTSVVGMTARPSGEWNVYFVTGVATRSFESNKANASFHLASQRQTIDLGPVFIFNLGPDADIDALPKN